MNFYEYQEKASRTSADLESKLLNDIHYVLGIVTEAGELADAFKKHIAYGKELDFVNLSEEIGDIMWYIANFCRINNFDFYNILETNIKKLQARYPEKFDEEHANHRDLDRERNILETGYSGIIDTTKKTAKGYK